MLLVPSLASAADPILPNEHLTPGVADTTVTLEKLCLAGYTGTVRNVSNAKKKVIFELYGIDPTKDKYEVDHLISLELGGSNDVKNLWPESYTTMPWNARVKDKLENRMHKLVCEGKLDLPTAQFEIATDWIKAYIKYIGNPLQ